MKRLNAAAAIDDVVDEIRGMKADKNLTTRVIPALNTIKDGLLSEDGPTDDWLGQAAFKAYTGESAHQWSLLPAPERERWIRCAQDVATETLA